VLLLISFAVFQLPFDKIAISKAVLFSHPSITSWFAMSLSVSLGTLKSCALDLTVARSCSYFSPIKNSIVLLGGSSSVF